MNQKNKRLKAKLLIYNVLAIVIISVLAIPLLISPAAGQNGTEITFAELLDDYDTGTSDFVSYIPDTEVVVVDKVVLVLYNESAQLTYIWLDSEGTDIVSARNLVLRDDQSGEYHVGDEIEITFVIRSDVSGEFYDYGLEDISHVKKVEREVEEHGLNIFGKHIDLPDALDNNYGRFLITLVFWLLIALLTLFILDPVIRQAVKGTDTQIDDIVLNIIRKPVLILIILYGLVDSLEQLKLSDDIMYYFRLIYGVVLIIMMTWIAIKVFKGVLIEVGRKWAKKTQARLEHVLIPMIEKMGTIMIFFFGMMYLLGYFGINLTLFVAGFGLTGLVIAFAAQDTLSNFFGGIFLIIEPNFKEGDTVLISDNYYKVSKIGMRTTQLYDIFKHMIVVVPNDKLANEMLINLCEPDRRIKENVKVGVAYGVDTKKVENLLLEIVKGHPDVITDEGDQKPFVRFSGFGDSALDFGVYFWVKDLDDRYRVKHELNHEIHARFGKEGIEIPFPQRVVHMVKDN